MTKQNFEIRRITPADDLAAIVANINRAKFGKDNELEDFTAEALRKCVENPENIYLVAYDGDKPAGLSYAMTIPSPDGDHWLYVDQVDTHPDYRRQGIGKQLLEELLKFGKEHGLCEMWLATEHDNLPAQALYQSLDPSKSEKLTDYTYKIK